MPLISNARISIGCPPPSSSLGLGGEDWTSLSFRIHDFASLSSTKDHFIDTPEFTCNGHEWKIQVYPGGSRNANEGYISAYLFHRSKGSTTKTDFAIRIIGKFGNVSKSKSANNRLFSSNTFGFGFPDFISRSNVLDESKNILDDNGILNFVVSIKGEPTTVFVPKHPILDMIKEMFNDESTSDVCFEVVVCLNDEGLKGRGRGKKKLKSSVSFHAHRSILKKCAPMLADLLGDNDSATISDIRPEIFNHLLYHIYGGDVSSEDLKAHAKEIINAADKYAIINLKLLAEAAYVESTSITFDNAKSDLLYADSKNCALLKEKVITFLADHPNEAAEKISFDHVPGHVVKDLLVVFDRKSKNESDATDANELTTLGVSDLRRKLYEKGLDVDGSREAMIESLKNSSSSS